MPNITATLPDTDQTVLRPAIFSVIEQVKNITGIPKDIKIIYPGDINKAQTAGSEFENQDKDRTAVFGNDRVLYIEVEDDFEKETILATAVSNVSTNPIFSDKIIGVSVRPVYATNTVTINFKYKTPSKTEAKRWRDNLRLKASQFRDINLHSIVYSYIIPFDVLSVIRIIYEMTKNVEPYNQTFEEFLYSRSTDRLTVVSDTVGQDARYTIAETGIRIQGAFDFEGISEKSSRDDDTGNWIIDFSYKFSFDQVIGCNMRYPIMVHNQLLPSMYIEHVNNDFNYDNVPKRFSDSSLAYYHFENDYIMSQYHNFQNVVTIPKQDDFVYTNAPSGTGTAISVLAAVEPDKRTLFNLNELGDYIIDSDILKFIKEVEYPYITKLYKSVISLDLYRNEKLAITDSLVCDNLLNIKSKTDLDLRKQHRVRISLVTDLTMLDQQAINRLMKYPKAFVKIIGSMNDILRNRSDFNKLGDLSKITPLHFNPIYRLMTGYDYNNGQGNKTGITDIGNMNSWNYQLDRRYAFRAFNMPLLNDIDFDLIDRNRKNIVKTNTIMITGIVALRKDE